VAFDCSLHLLFGLSLQFGAGVRGRRGGDLGLHRLLDALHVQRGIREVLQFRVVRSRSGIGGLRCSGVALGRSLLRGGLGLRERGGRQHGDGQRHGGRDTCTFDSSNHCVVLIGEMHGVDTRRTFDRNEVRNTRATLRGAPIQAQVGLSGKSERVVNERR